ncbi:dTDP-4-dehydrorhamnose 3,5-epimerase [Novosphingobium sp.]|uniref:dTDP-4-dehydrorhamnose 3,5-epimerase n=1 Tax=Novosphingobium sp. TaxID=1874826 RepID=UPI003B52DC60
MKFNRFALAGPVEIVPTRHGDDRGFFAEAFRVDRFSAAVGEYTFIQENESLSALVGTIRGLHFQSHPMAQGKLVRCVAGAIFDVAVDVRHDSPTFRHWIGIELDPERGNQLWVPPGFAHGFCTLAPNSVVSYKVTSYYSAENDRGMRWDDPAVGVIWPGLANPATLSAKDRIQPLLEEIPPLFSIGDGM